LQATPQVGGVDDTIAGLVGSGTPVSSMKEFHALRNLDPTSLAPDQLARMKAIREAIPDPIDGEMMQKVIKEADIQSYLDGTFTEIRGFVAKEADVSDLTTASDVIEGLRLDYPGGFSEPTR